MGGQGFGEPVGQAGLGVQVVETDVEQGGGLGGDDVAGRVADIDAGELQAGGLEPGRAVVQFFRQQRGQSGDQAVQGIVGQMRIGDVALAAGHGDGGGQAAAAADFDHVAEHGAAGWFADQAEIGDFFCRRHPVQNLRGAVEGFAFLVACDEQGDFGAPRAGAGGRGGEGGDGALHVAGATAVQKPFFDFAAKRVVAPFRAGGHDVGVAGEAEMGCFAAALGVKVVDVPEGQARHGKAGGFEVLGENALSAGILRRDRGAAEQRLRQRQRIHHARKSSLIEVLARVCASTRLTMTAQARLGPAPPSGKALPGSAPGTTTE